MIELIDIQHELKVPKGRTNTSGGYGYRTCEDIFVALKPILNKCRCTLIMSDDIQVSGERVYVKSTAILTNERGVKEQCSAFAREPLTRDDLSDSQITGSASTYARKCALCGLFLIDDSSSDPDAVEKSKSTEDNDAEVKVKKGRVKQQKTML